MSETIIMTHADSIWAKSLEAHNDSLQRSVDALQAKLDALQSKTDLLTNVVETANDGVSNQLSSATYWLEVIAILIAIGGFVLGFYISYKKRQIEIMAQTVDDKKKDVEELAKVVDEKTEKVENVAQTTEELDKQIHNNLSALYKDLRDEETKTLLERLVVEPLDISNLSRMLLSRDLPKEGFCILKDAFYKYLEDLGDNKESVTLVGTYSDHYLALFFQHYVFFSITDDVIRSKMEKRFDYLFSIAFKRDIIKSTTEFCKGLSDENSSFNKEDILVDYLKALNNSQHNELFELKIIFDQNITPQTLLQKAIDRCTADGEYLTLFGINPPEKNEKNNQS